jgi:hypothetical protein
MMQKRLSTQILTNFKIFFPPQVIPQAILFAESARASTTIHLRN